MGWDKNKGNIPDDYLILINLYHAFCLISATTSGAKSEKIVFGGITMSYGESLSLTGTLLGEALNILPHQISH